MLLAVAAWTPWPRVMRRRIEDWRLVMVPALSLLAALGVFVYGNLHRQLTLPALILAIATVLAVCARLMLTVRENLRMLIGSRQLALTDPLTGLGNRRRLMEDLQLACRLAKPEAPWRLAMYDLNGFKRYNDTYGHPAGDALLARLSDKLGASVAAHGTAYRMGGDEFCVLFKCAAVVEAEVLRASVAALCEDGPGFAIGAAHGEVSIPTEAHEPTDVLRLADQHLYRRKDKTREEYVARQSHTGARAGGRFDPAVVAAFADTTIADAPPTRVDPRATRSRCWARRRAGRRSARSRTARAAVPRGASRTRTGCRRGVGAARRSRRRAARASARAGRG